MNENHDRVILIAVDDAKIIGVAILKDSYYEKKDMYFAS